MDPIREYGECGFTPEPATQTHAQKFPRDVHATGHDVFWALAMVGALMVPLALIMKPIELGAAPKGH
jgi:hypothetical protein